MRVFGFIAVLFAGSLLAACSAERMAALDQCEAEAYSKYPPKYETRMEQDYRYIDVPTGEVNCTTRQDGISSPTTCRSDYYGNVTCNQGYEPPVRTNCKPVTKQEKQYFQKEVRVDVNREVRQDFKYQCADQLCVRKFGNVDCNPDTRQLISSALSSPRTYAPSGVPSEFTLWWNGYHGETKMSPAHFRASAVAFDEITWAPGTGIGSTEAAAIQMALSDCDKQRLKFRIRPPCKIYDVNYKIRYQR